MSQLTLTPVRDVETTNSDWNRLCKLGGIVAWIQLGCLLFTIISLTILGAEPTTAEATYKMLQDDGFVGLLRLDFATLILLALFPFVAVALFTAFRYSQQAYALLALVLILMGTLLGLANHSAFSIMYLSDLYAAAATAAQQEQFLAAGEAVIASNMWNSTAGFLAGIFMQGGFVFISFVMLRSKEFSKGTAYTGILSNGLDLIHVFIMLFAPALATTVLSIGGVFYLIWFPLLGRDLYRLGKDVSPD
ncbi:MAG: DUF4386 family protein [Chloroflexi bacterium]|nr:DUF4386 family protein [Chloroflexota bacterium]